MDDLNKPVITFRTHAIKRMFERNISQKDVYNTLCNGTVVEKYDNDEPYPSKLQCLIESNRPIHVVSAYNVKQNEIIIITAYIPDREKWKNNYTCRIKNEMRYL